MNWWVGRGGRSGEGAIRRRLGLACSFELEVLLATITCTCIHLSVKWAHLPPFSIHFPTRTGMSADLRSPSELGRETPNLPGANVSSRALGFAKSLSGFFHFSSFRLDT